MSDNTQRMRFLDVFTEDKNETLTLKINLKVKGTDFQKGESFTKEERIGGVDFHLLRYLDLAVTYSEEEDKYEVTGFFPQK